MNNKRLALLTNFTAANRLVNIATLQAALLTIPSLHAGFDKRVVRYDANITAVLVEPDGTGKLVMSCVTRKDANFIPDLLAAGYAPVDLGIAAKSCTINDIVTLVRNQARMAYADQMLAILDEFEAIVKRSENYAAEVAAQKLERLAKLI